MYRHYKMLRAAGVKRWPAIRLLYDVWRKVGWNVDIWLKSFKPDDLVEGEQPTAEITIDIQKKE